MGGWACLWGQANTGLTVWPGTRALCTLAGGCRLKCRIQIINANCPGTGTGTGANQRPGNQLLQAMWHCSGSHSRQAVQVPPEHSPNKKTVPTAAESTVSMRSWSQSHNYTKCSTTKSELNLSSWALLLLAAAPDRGGLPCSLI